MTWLWLGAWLIVGAMAMLLAMRLFPSAFFKKSRDSDEYTGWLTDSYHNDVTVPGQARAILGTIFWPMALIWILVALFGRGTMNSINKKTRVMAEVETELRAAKKEIDELLRRQP